MSERLVCVGADIAGYSLRRSHAEQEDVQRRLHFAVSQALTMVKIDVHDCAFQPRGDGLMLALPPGVSELTTLPRFAAATHTSLAAINSLPGRGGVLRVRLSAAAGPAGPSTPIGFTGATAVETADLLDCPQAKAALADHPDTDLVLTVGGQLVEAFEQDYGGIVFPDLEPIEVTVKTRAWRGALARRLPTLPLPAYAYRDQLDRQNSATERDRKKMWFMAGTMFTIPFVMASWPMVHHPDTHHHTHHDPHPGDHGGGHDHDHDHHDDGGHHF